MGPSSKIPRKRVSVAGYFENMYKHQVIIFLVAQSFSNSVSDVFVLITKPVLKSGARRHFVPEKSKVLIPHVWGIHSMNLRSLCNILFLGRVSFSVFSVARSVPKSGALRQNAPIISIINHILHIYKFLLNNMPPIRYHLLKQILSKGYRDQTGFTKIGSSRQNSP